MKTLGYMKVVLLPLMISGTIMGSSIASPTPPLRNPTSEESTSCRRENPEGQSAESPQSQTGKRYYGSSDELKRDIKEFGKEVFRREIISLHNTKGWVNYEETRQLFLNNVLSETENYYNSNILGRYMKKDYYNEQRTTCN